MTRQIDVRLVVWAGTHARRDELVARVRSWLERKGEQVDLRRWGEAGRPLRR